MVWTLEITEKMMILKMVTHGSGRVEVVVEEEKRDLNVRMKLGLN